MQQIDRRAFLGGTAMTFAAAELASPAIAKGPAIGASPPALVKQVRAGVLDVGYLEAGPTSGEPVFLLHGWPYDIHSFDEVTPILASRGFKVIVPNLRGYGSTRFVSPDTTRSGEPAAVAKDLLDLMDALKIRSAVLAGFDWGARTGDIVAALWPDRARGLVSVSGYLIGSPAAEKQPLPPEAEYQWWYQFYFATERGQIGYAKNRHDFNKLIWKLASPRWNFDDATYERSAVSFDNPDHAAIVIHNYRWRLGLTEGDPSYAEIARRFEALPPISVPTITMEGDANGAPHPPPEAYRARFTGRYEHRTIRGGIGHNLPQEAPRDFAQAVIDVAGQRTRETLGEPTARRVL